MTIVLSLSVSHLLNKDPGVHLGWVSVKRRVQWTISTLSFCSEVVKRELTHSLSVQQYYRTVVLLFCYHRF